MARACVVYAACVLTASHAVALPLLPRLNISEGSISVSGVSSGAAMAMQYHVAFSGSLRGAGIIASPPWYCALNNVDTALTACMKTPALIDVAFLHAEARRFAARGDIDDLSKLNTSRVYVETGKYDTVVLQPSVQKAAQWYGKYVTAGNMVEASYLPAEHCWPTDRYGHACAYLGEPYINNCGYDASGAFLQHIYGTLHPRTQPDSTSLSLYDQAVYGASSRISMFNQLAAYIPKACHRGTPCKLHIAFHGCKQTIPDINDVFYSNVGLNEWAESNNIVVLYPQAQRSPLIPYNPKGCWDWWGYTNGKYVAKTGVQMAVISKMIEAVTGRPMR